MSEYEINVNYDSRVEDCSSESFFKVSKGQTAIKANNYNFYANE